MLRSLLTWAIRLLLLIVTLLTLATTWLWWSNRDIPMAELEQQFGGNGLQRVMIDGVNLAYRVEGQGPSLVLIHSHFYTMRQWQQWVDTLKEDFTVVRFDLTSHGLTGPDPSEDYSRARGSVLLQGLLNHLHIEKASIAGSSTGGALAWYFAANYPQRVDRLILINAPGMPRVTNKYMERGMPDWMGYLFYLFPQSMFKPFLQAPVVDKTLITDARVEEFHRMYRGEGNRWAEFLRMQAWERGDIAPQLEKITSPVLVMWGEKNPQLPVEHVEQYQQQLINSPRVETRVYPDIGHVVPLEIPVASAIDARAFLLEHL
mgnify:CR=1 FL=1